MTCIRVSALSAFHFPGFLSTLDTIVSGLEFPGRQDEYLIDLSL